MSSHDQAKLVDLQEFFDLVRAVHHDVVLFLRVADHVGVNAVDFFGGGGVRPQQVHCHLLDSVCNRAQVDLQRPVNLLQVLKLHERCANTTMHAEYLMLSFLVSNGGTKRHPLEQVVAPLEHTVRVLNVFAKSLRALLTKPEVSVHISVFVVTSKQEDLLGVLQLKGHQKADHFE